MCGGVAVVAIAIRRLLPDRQHRRRPVGDAAVTKFLRAKPLPFRELFFDRQVIVSRLANALPKLAEPTARIPAVIYSANKT